jgi:hypothetical protein
MRLFPVFAAVLVSGCIVLPTRMRDAGLARVLDADSAAPLVGARVIVPSWWRVLPIGRKGRLAGVYRTTTDGEGYFRVPSGSKWVVHFLAPDGGRFYSSGICIEKDGYGPFEADPWENPAVRHPPSIGISGTFYLRRSSEAATTSCPSY